MFACLRTEQNLDDFIAARPESLADVGNFLQTVVENDGVRVDLKRAACLAELHRAHYVDARYVDETLGLPSHLVRLYFEALDEIVDAYLVGSIDEREFVSRCEAVRSGMMRLHEGDERAKKTYRLMAGFAESSRSGTMRGFDSRFTRLAAEAYVARLRGGGDPEKKKRDDEGGLARG